MTLLRRAVSGVTAVTDWLLSADAELLQWAIVALAVVVLFVFPLVRLWRGL
ncbi:MAG: hypothetical protein KGL35_24725 [Bradyrhizobium sp.]|nr:hypothetical protein [Bradyrhizobium sp.]